MYRTLPSRTNSAMAPTVSSIGNGFIDAVLIVEINYFNAEPLEAGLTSGTHVIRMSFNAEKLTVGSADVAELGGENYFIATIFDGAAHQLFIAARSVHVSGIKKVAAQFKRAVNGGNGFRIIASAIKL